MLDVSLLPTVRMSLAAGVYSQSRLGPSSRGAGWA